mgnify:CR=1 FL=1
MKKSRILSLMLAGLMLVGCQPKKAEDKNEKKKVETTKNFEGKTLNVVATSEKYKKLFDKFSEETKAEVEFQVEKLLLNSKLKVENQVLTFGLVEE